MTTDTEALRRAFEAFSLDGGLAPGDLEWDGRFYIVPFTQDEWLTFQAGHAAAAAGTATPVAARWYFVTNDGAATLCVDEADAREGAAEADIAYPRMAPHRAVRLVPASQVAAAVAKERDRCASIADSQHFGGDFDDEPMWTTCAARIASAIRAGEPSDG